MSTADNSNQLAELYREYTDGKHAEPYIFWLALQLIESRVEQGELVEACRMAWQRMLNNAGRGHAGVVIDQLRAIDDPNN